jgi:hypothetical protein
MTARPMWPLLWLFLAGCGAASHMAAPLPVEGFVKWEKGMMATELEGGTVEFEKDGAVAATAALTGDGSFKLLKPLPAGTYRVRIQPPATPARKGAEIAPQYQKFETSGLTFSAGGEPKPVVFELKARGR